MRGLSTAQPENTAPVQPVESPDGLDWLRNFPDEVASFWRCLPDGWFFAGLLVAWFLLFHFLGNSVLGYGSSPSLFSWMYLAYVGSESPDAHGLYMPMIVLGILFARRKELSTLRFASWWPGLLIFAFCLVLHIAGFLIQQTRVSILAFFGGIWGMMGVFWGWRWLKATFFPFFLFLFCVPLGTLSENVSFPLRMMVSDIVGTICHGIGIDVIQQGNVLKSPDGSYHYEVAAACSGLRSLVATVVIAIIYAFLAFKQWPKRLILLASAVPLAVLGNVVRLLTIVLAAEIFGQKGGSAVHDSSFFSLLPYIPAIGGLLWLGSKLEGRGKTPQPETTDAGKGGPS